MINIGISIALSLMQYLFYFFFLTLGTLYLFKELTNEEERQAYRTKLLKEINQRKTKLIKVNQSSKLQEKLNSIGISFFKAIHFQVARIAFIFVVSTYYIFSNLIYEENFKLSLLAIPCLLFLLTEPTLKYTPVNMILNYLIKTKQKKRMTELFHLFDLLKSEFNSNNNGKHINIYNVIQDFLPMFKEIQSTLSKFLIKWKHSPQEASKVFEREIGGDSAKVLGDILFKLENVSRNKALEIINSESSVFTTSYYESQLQESAKQKTIVFSIFIATLITTSIWLIVFVNAMTKTHNFM